MRLTSVSPLPIRLLREEILLKTGAHFGAGRFVQYFSEIDAVRNDGYPAAAAKL